MAAPASATPRVQTTTPVDAQCTSKAENKQSTCVNVPTCASDNAQNPASSNDPTRGQAQPSFGQTVQRPRGGLLPPRIASPLRFRNPPPRTRKGHRDLQQKRRVTTKFDLSHRVSLTVFDNGTLTSLAWSCGAKDADVLCVARVASFIDVRASSERWSPQPRPPENPPLLACLVHALPGCAATSTEPNLSFLFPGNHRLPPNQESHCAPRLQTLTKRHTVQSQCTAMQKRSAKRLPNVHH